MITTAYGNVLFANDIANINANDAARFQNSVVATRSPWDDGLEFDIIGAGFFLANTENATLKPILVTSLTTVDKDGKKTNQVLYLSMLIKEHLKEDGTPVQYRKNFNDLCEDANRRMSGLAYEPALNILAELVGYKVKVRRTAYQSGRFTKSAIGMEIVGERNTDIYNAWKNSL